LEDGAPAHTSRFDEEFHAVNKIKKMCWPGYSPDISTEEYAWSWIRRLIAKDFEPSRTEKECIAHWEYEWVKLPQETINKWINRIPDVVRQIIKYRGDSYFHEGGEQA
ncbi:hypothetical protein K469DRAFT_597746, partial [Zopfia rhizophila CBS 207.26]